MPVFLNFQILKSCADPGLTSAQESQETNICSYLLAEEKAGGREQVLFTHCHRPTVTSARSNRALASPVRNTETVDSLSLSMYTFIL